MTEDTEDNNDSDETGSATNTRVNATPTVATGWVVPTLESDLKKRADSLQNAIEQSEGEYTHFLTNHQDELVVFFAIASEILDDLGRDLFTQKLLAERYRNRDDVNDNALVDQLGGPKKFEMLKHYGILPEELASDIQATQGYRARLVHDPQKRHRITDLGALNERIQTAFNAVFQIERLVER